RSRRAVPSAASKRPKTPVPSAPAGSSSERGTSVTSKSSSSPARRRSGRVGGEAGEQAMGGEDGEAGIVESGERHQRVVLRALAADLVAVGAGGLVAVVAVGDQELGVGEVLDHRGDDGRI